MGYDAATRRGFPALMFLAVLLNGFAFVTVNYWIYTARWRFIETQAEGEAYAGPPTISRALGPDFIGVPFAFWITVSGICLFVGVGCLALNYFAMRQHLVAPKRSVLLAFWVLLPVGLLLQLGASLGMHFLSAYRLPHFRDAHMMGSYAFFGCQAVVVIGYSMFNHILLRDPDNLTRLAAAGVIAPKWVKFRRNFGALAFAFILFYGGLFVAKDLSDDPGLYLVYVSTEPLVITAFLLVLAFAHVDKFRRSAAVGLP